MDDIGAACAVCGRISDRRYRFSATPPQIRCLRHAILFRPVLRRALRVAAVVGTVLVAINQGDILLRGDVTPGVAAKIALTYLVPFAVSTYSALAINAYVAGGTTDPRLNREGPG